MAEAISITGSNYSGDKTSEIISLAVTNSDTVQKGLVRVETGIQKERQIERLDVTSFVQKRKATPISKGNVAIDYRSLVPQDIMVYIEMNPRDFEQTWNAEQLYNAYPKLVDRELTTEYKNPIMSQTMKRFGEFLDSQYWIGRIEFDDEGANVDPTTKGLVATDSVYSYFDGFLKKWLDASGKIAVGSPSAITKANIRDKFAAALKLIPKALLFKYGNLGLKFLVSYADAQKYQDALTEDVYKNNNTTEASVMKYNAYDIVPVAGMPENTFFLGLASSDMSSNFYLGINDLADMSLDMQKKQANSELYFIKGLFKMDVQLGFIEQMVVHTTITV